MGNSQESCFRKPTQLGGSPLVTSFLSSGLQIFHLMTGSLKSILDYIVIFRIEVRPLAIEQKDNYSEEFSLDYILLVFLYVREN